MTAELVERHATCWRDSVAPQLAKAGIRIVHWSDLGHRQRETLGTYFREQIFPVLTPLAVDPAHPFPYISGLSLNLGVMVRTGDAGGPNRADGSRADRALRPGQGAAERASPGPRRDASSAGAATRTATSKTTFCYVPLEELIAAHLPQLFPGMDVVDSVAFRVTRNQELEVEEDEAEDLLQALERELARRRFGRAVRLEIQGGVAERDPRAARTRARSRPPRRLRGARRPARPVDALGACRTSTALT